MFSACEILYDNALYKFTLHYITSYRPISNLNFISKILERLFLARLQPHSTSSPSVNQLQSAYRRHRSTETPILHILGSILLSSDSGKSTTVISLDLSAAFVTIDHQILLSRQNTGFYRAMLCIRGTIHRPVSVCVCPSVCLSQVGVLLKRLNFGSHKQNHTIPPGTLVFWRQRSP